MDMTGVNRCIITLYFKKLNWLLIYPFIPTSPLMVSSGKYQTPANLRFAYVTDPVKVLCNPLLFLNGQLVNRMFAISAAGQYVKFSAEFNV